MGSEQAFVGRLSEFLRSHSLIERGDHIVLAVSGGVDSVAMLDAFCRLRPAWNLELVAAHVNHQLRGEESDGDESFVREAAARYGIPFFFRRVDVTRFAHDQKISKQEAAREMRYACLEEIRQQTSSHRIATAHHADDSAETVLLNILRGTGLRGLAGIPLMRDEGRIIRPLLFANREEILAFASGRQLAFREDSTNSSTVYTRNYIRHAVIPSLEKEFGPQVRRSLDRLSATVRKFDKHLDTLVEGHVRRMVTFRAGGSTVSIPSFTVVPLFVQEEVVLRILRHLNVEPTQPRVRKIIDFCRHQTGRSLDVTGKIIVRRNRGVLDFDAPSPDPEIRETLRVGETFHGPGFQLSVGAPGPVPNVVPHGGLTEYIDAGKLDRSLIVRSWKDGDWFVPLGMRGRKKLSDYFGDAKVPRGEKKKIPILESNDRIVWVCGKRLDERFKITAETRSAIKLTFTPTISP